MPPDGSGTGYDDWVLTTLGVDPRGGSPGMGSAAPGGAGPAKPPPLKPPPLKPMTMKAANPKSPIGKAAADPKVWTRSVGDALTRQGPYKTGARIKPPVPAGPPTVCTGADGRSVSIVKGKDGRVALTRDPPPITEITFAGGGGKGNALPGAVRALTESGALKSAKELHGASVGSLTASLLAAGVTPEEFQSLSDNTDFLALVKGSDLLPVNVSGEGFEGLIRNTMKGSLGKQISTYAHDAQKNGETPDPKILATLNEMTDRFGKGAGPTFMDMRVLHGIIPAIKEVVITGTLKPEDGEPKDKSMANGKQAELMVFSADTQPQMEVAKAVHASAAIPPVFKPVTLDLAGNRKGVFQDGGIKNNVPTGDSLGLHPNLDPVPEGGSISFMFQDDTTDGILAGKASSDRQIVRDKLLGSDMSATEYTTRAGLADRPEDLVVVPLKFTRKDGSKADFTGMMGGTMKFDMAKDDRVKLQGMTQEATEAHLKKRQQKETRSFASVQQMLACTTREDLKAMADSKFPGAAEELAFRDEVVKQVAALEALAAGGAKPDDKPVQAILKAMTAGAAGDQERVAFIGREMNRSGKLTKLMSQAKAHPGHKEPDALAAGMAVAGVLAARTTARRIRQTLIAPKLVRTRPGGSCGMILAQMDTQLDDAQSSADINRTLRIGIKTFRHSFDPGDVFGDRAFAAALAKQIQPDH